MCMTRVLLVCLLSLAGGCAVRPPWPDPEGAARTAAAVDAAIELNLEAESVDVEPSIGDQLGFAVAVKECLHRSPDIQAALMRVRVAQSESHQARLLPNPIVSVVLRWPESGGSPILEAGLAAELLSLLTKPGRVSAADNRLRSAAAEAVTVVLDVLTELRSRYVEVQALDATMPILHERQRLLGRLHQVAESRLRAGEGIRLDVTTLRSQQVELEIEIAERELERRVSRLSLARLVGRPSDEADWQVESWEPPPEALVGESRWLAAAMTHRPEIQAIRWELEALGEDLRSTRWAWLEGEVGIDSEREGDWSVGPSFTAPLPIFDWGQANEDGAEARRLEVTHRLTSVRRQIVEEVRREYASLTVLRRALIQMRDDLIPLLELRGAEAESAYRAGQSDVSAVILAQQELQSGRARVIDMGRKAKESLIRLERTVGGPGYVPAPERTNAETAEAVQEIAHE